MVRTSVNEGSTSYHTFTITNRAGDPVSPSALRYRLLASGGVVLVPWATLNTQATEIEVSAANNTIGTYGRARFLTIEATHSGGDVITEELEYELRDLKGIS